MASKFFGGTSPGEQYPVDVEQALDLDVSTQQNEPDPNFAGSPDPRLQAPQPTSPVPAGASAPGQLPPSVSANARGYVPPVT